MKKVGWAAFCVTAALALACSADGAPDADTIAHASADAPSASGSRVRMVEVNQGASGMLSHVRWALSDDRSAILVMEDAVSVENEAFPNGFVLARETENGVSFVQMDSVWDAAPSPDWTAAAFGRAHRVSAGERDSLSTEQWDSLAAAAGMPVADVRRGAFPASGMAIMVGLAQPGIVRLDGQEPKVWPVAAGWRVAWSRDGSRIAAGMAPAPRVDDDAEASRWVALDTATGMPRGELPDDFQRFEPRWTDGPLIDISVTRDTTERLAIAIDSGSVVSVNNRISRNGVEIGTGIALAATRRGRVIVALAPNPNAQEYEPKERLVVYLVEP
jgi:hypothetical protein